MSLVHCDCHIIAEGLLLHSCQGIMHPAMTFFYIFYFYYACSNNRLRLALLFWSSSTLTPPKFGFLPLSLFGERCGVSYNICQICRSVGALYCLELNWQFCVKWKQTRLLLHLFCLFWWYYFCSKPNHAWCPVDSLIFIFGGNIIH